MYKLCNMLFSVHEFDKLMVSVLSCHSNKYLTLYVLVLSTDLP